MAYTSTTVAWRGKVADAVSQVQRQHDPSKDVSGRIKCPHCRSPLQFTIQADGKSHGKCVSSSCVRW